MTSYNTHTYMYTLEVYVYTNTIGLVVVVVHTTVDITFIQSSNAIADTSSKHTEHTIAALLLQLLH
jgi:hypothetical protein